MRSRIYDSNLQDSFARLARDADLEDGIIRPRESYTLVKQSADPIVTIYEPSDLNGECLELCCYDECVSAMPAPAGQCAGLTSLVVFPRYGEPYRQMIPGKERKCLYVPAPTEAPIVNISSSGTLEEQDTRFYTYTWTDEFGIESPPAPPSQGVTLAEDGTVDLTGLMTAPTCACFINIYRTAPPFRDGANPNLRPNETTWQLVATISVGAIGYTDNKPLRDACFGTLCTEDNCPPPAMCKVVETQHGYYVGFDGNNVYVSERHEPHNWPEYNRITIEDRAVDIVDFYDTVFITTTGRPYQLTIQPNQDGTTNIGQLPYPRIDPGFRDTLVRTAFGAVYAGSEGLVGLVPQGSARNLTRDRISPREWKTCRPHTMAWLNGKLYGFRPDNGSFVLDIHDTENGSLEPGDFVYLSIPATTAITGNKGEVYFTNNGAVYRLGGPIIPYSWESKHFTTPSNTMFTAAKVVSSGGPVRFRVWSGEKLIYDREIKTNKPLRLPRLRRHTDWRFRLDGLATVREVTLATSIRELSRT